MVARIRALVLKTAPEVTEDWKWGVPVWVHNGNVLACGIFKDRVKLNFFKGGIPERPEKTIQRRARGKRHARHRYRRK